ncbi:C1 family peptidase [Prevotella sp.]|uniref:aminopeptidase C n=1 Tax=uncultured Prevotella sp. TaxID=159272 RepID=UPI0027E37A67|nr:C1 family peptidase [Prevotella sp.]
MNTKTLALGLCLALATTAGAQNKQGGISAEMLQNIEKTQKATTTADKALFNALASNKIDDLAKNFGNNRYTNDHFSVETAKQSIHNQKSSGRCWMFSSFNVLRSDFAHNHGDSVVVDFSHVYLFFFDQLEKANLMLQGVIDNAKKPIDDQRVQFFFKNPLNDGGTFCGAADLAPKYGLVPMSVQPETFSAENTSKISSLISTKLREFGLELRKMVADGKKVAAINQRKTEMLGTVYHMLSITMGEPVKEFTYQFRNKDGKAVGEPRRFTPKSFYDEVVGHPLEGTFIMVMNDPRRPYHKTYEVEYDRHVYDGQNWKYLNLPVEDIAKLAIASLKDGKKMYSSYDVGKQLDRASGYLDTENFDYGSLFSTSFNKMNKAERIATFDSGSTHAMTLTAVDLDKDGNPIKWKVENSWGANNGVNGCLIMTNRWFNEYMFRLVVDKKYVPETLLKEFDQKPLMVMPEDPLFGQDD